MDQQDKGTVVRIEPAADAPFKILGGFIYNDASDECIAKLGLLPECQFVNDIDRFCEMYKLPAAPFPDMMEERLDAFRSILAEEVREMNEIQEAKYAPDISDLALLTMWADLLGDIVVYCFNESKRLGIPLFDVLGIIMQSNFSKLGAEGQPIYDERGKVMKGPNYWKPEPKIKALLQSLMEKNQNG